MPIFNGIEFLDDSVKSVLDQSFEDWELIIGINGHPPNSVVYDTAKEYELLYGNRIRVLDFPTIKGKANTLNAMVPYCNYDFVALLDVDDIWLPNKLLLQSVFMDDYDVVGSQCVYFDDPKLHGVHPTIPIGNISSVDFTKGNPVINSSAIIRKHLCYWNDTWESIEDYDLWLRLWKQGCRFYNCNEVLVKHRIHPTSAFNSRGQAVQLQELLRQYTN